MVARAVERELFNTLLLIKAFAQTTRDASVPAALLGRTKWGLEERLRVCGPHGGFHMASSAELTLVRFIIVELRTSDAQ